MSQIGVPLDLGFPNTDVQESAYQSAHRRPSLVEGAGAAIATQWALSWAGRQLAGARFTPDPNFRLTREVEAVLTAGLPEPFWDFSEAVSLDHAMELRQQRLTQVKHLDTLGRLGWQGTALSLGAAMFDPVDLTLGAGVTAMTGGTGLAPWIAGKAGRLRRLAGHAIVGAAAAVPVQAYISSQDPTQDWEDVLFAAAGGAIGGAGLDAIGQKWAGAWRGIRGELDARAVYAAGVAANPTAAPRAVFDELLSDKGRVYFRDTLSPEAQRAAGVRMIDSLGLDEVQDADLIASLRAELDADPDIMLRRFTTDPYGSIELRERSPVDATSAAGGAGVTDEPDAIGAEPRRRRIAGDFILPERLSDEEAAKFGRLPTYSTLVGTSASPTARAMGFALVNDHVSIRNRPQIDTASAWSRRTHDGIMGQYRRQKDQAYRAWLTANRTSASARARDAFEREVGLAYHSLGTPRASAPGIAEAIKAHQQLTRTVGGIAQRHGVSAFENLTLDDSYFSRVYSPSRLVAADNKHTRAEVERLFGEAFRRANPDAPENIVQAVGRNMPRALTDLRTRTEFSLVGAMRGIDRDELARLLADLEVDGTIADEILGSVKPRPDGTVPPMGRRRTLLDEATTIDTPQGPLALTDLLENNADKIAARYTSTLVGASAMATVYRALSRTLGVEVRRFEDVAPIIERELAGASVPRDKRVRGESAERTLETLSEMDRQIRRLTPGRGAMMPANPATQTQPATPTTPTTEPKPAPGRKPGLWRGRPFPAKVKTPEPKPMPEPALLSRRQAAALLGVGVTRVRDWDKHELMPSAITLPTHRPWEVHWRRDELRAWTIAGCPPRARWTWEPTRLPTLRQLIEGAERELLILRDQVQRARAELDTLHAAQEAAERARDGRA